MDMQMVLLALRGATRHPFLCREQPQRCGDESLPGEKRRTEVSLNRLRASGNGGGWPRETFAVPTTPARALSLRRSYSCGGRKSI